MKLIERVYYSILGKPVKSLLLFLVVSLLGSFLSASFSIYQANKSLEKEVREKLNPVVLIEWQWNNSDNNLTPNEEEQIKQNIINTYKKDRRLKDMENRYLLYLDGLYFQSLNKNGNINNFFGHGGASFFNDTGTLIEVNNVLDLVGIDNANIMDIDNGTMSLIVGRVFSENEILNGENSCFYQIPYNNSYLKHKLESIDSINLVLNDQSLNYEYDVNDGKQILNYTLNLDLIGAGIQLENTAVHKYHSIFYNETSSGIYISSILMDDISDYLIKYYKNFSEKYPSILKRKNYEYYGMKYAAETYITLKDVNDLNDFVYDLEKDCNGFAKNIYSYSDSYNDVQTITKSLNTIAIISLIVCSLASIILLSLIIQVFVHERRYEIGVFLAIGESRKNIILQIFLEVVIVGMLGISVSLFAGNMIGKSLSSDLLEKQIVQYENVYEDMTNGQDYEINQKEIMNSYRVEITSEYVLCVNAGGFIVLLLSCLYPMNNILKMKAKKMLQ